MTGALLFVGFLALIFVIYFLTEKPEKHELPLPPIRKSRTVDVEPWGREVTLEPPAVIAPMPDGLHYTTCDHPRCPYPREPNLRFCRGHEGGFDGDFKGRTEVDSKYDAFRKD